MLVASTQRPQLHARPAYTATTKKSSSTPARTTKSAAHSLSYGAAVFLLIIVLGTTVVAATDWFDVADANHDGVVDRTEYDVALDKFMLELEHRDGGGAGGGRVLDGSSSSFSSFWKSFVSNTETGFWKAFTSSVAMILATEVGDKTFFIAAVLSMKHERLAVFTGAIAALILMTVLSTAMGLVLPKFLDRKYTHILSGILFLYFGIKLIYDSRSMEGGKHSEELEEVEEELMLANNKKGDVELPTHNNANSSKSSAGLSSSQSIILTALTLTFVAEWGDRSQIATIALASAKNPIGVTIGGILGHSICTASACIGGRMLASNISEKTVSQWGGVVFLLFGVHSFFFEA